ncbi:MULTISPECIES: hypothetical protein [Lelliottia]|uniref:Uncharacterized protein n=1 Tax=Lelliottia aquatilis TaxID=2080838 RepID=A0ABX5A7I2_9ENTR|nr:MULTISPECIES: hypothetical protein [Lelliottia]POZ13505.1 hypothetical protein C3Z09_23090 [Lelliottia aquatilis]POZ25970.1 hypothetical protein C3712_04385 [Lelliottia aquatilis]POZ29126.1 hypothetical protein C3708_04385 [Lelliottia sp. 7254-16]POZ29524.1 hypothetical protein C3711_05615 [Lelliottia aquatilis]POZ33431.1 hypothetical protein C3710_08375 [Lelliottia aquatilis]
MRFMYAILSAGSLAFAMSAQAVPNMWSSGFGMGVTEYIITSPENVMLNLNCTGNPDDQNILQHHVMLTLPDGSGADSQDENTAITVVTDDQPFPLPSSLGWRNGDNAWLSFIDAISKATSFEIYVNDKKVGHFSPSAGNVHKVLADMSGCTTFIAE